MTLLWIFLAVVLVVMLQALATLQRIEGRVDALEDRDPVEIELKEGETPRIVIHGDHRSK